LPAKWANDFQRIFVDYADSETREIGEQLIQKELKEIPKDIVRRKTVENLQKIEEGKRDIYF
jgi:2-iminoacetate synthase